MTWTWMWTSACERKGKTQKPEEEEEMTMVGNTCKSQVIACILLFIHYAPLSYSFALTGRGVLLPGRATTYITSSSQSSQSTSTRRTFLLSSSSSSTINKTSKSSPATKSSKGKDGMVCLNFIGKTELSSKQITLDTAASDSASDIVEQFFQNSSNKNLLLADPKSVKLNTLRNPSQKLLNTWKKETKGYEDLPSNAQEFDSDDTCEIVQLKTSVKFPGLKVNSISKIASKLILNSEDIAEKKYEFTLIESSTEPEGFGPLVAIFNKLTGANNKKKSSNSSINDDDDAPLDLSSMSFTTVKMNSTGKNTVYFTSDALIHIKVEFPSFLIKILPTSIEKMEQSGSQSMQSVVEKEVGPALERFANQFEREVKK